MSILIAAGRPVLAALLAGVLLWPGRAPALTLDQALRLAETDAPLLDAQAAARQAARSAAIPAGELPDPKLVLGVQNLPVDSSERWTLNRDPMSMKVIGVAQQMINADKRQARTDAAMAGVEVADRQQQITWLAVRRQTALAWIDSLALEKKLALFRELYAENRLFERTVRARIAGGSGAAADAVLPQQEKALLDEQQDELEARRRTARAQLGQWIGPAPASEPLQGDWPFWPVDPAHYRHNLERHPELAIFAAQTRQAEARVREARAEKIPDWGWEVDYQHRGQAYSNMVSLKLTFDLPVFTGTRQDPKIAAGQALLAQLEAEREARTREHDALLAGDLARFDQLDQALQRVDHTLLPLARQRVQRAMADYRGGRGTLQAVVEARREQLQTRLRRIDVARQRAAASAVLYFAYGDLRS